MTFKEKTVKIGHFTGQVGSWMVTGAFLILVACLIFVVYEFMSVSRWDPFTFQSPQKIDQQVELIHINDAGTVSTSDYPAIKINTNGDTIVRITGTKCNNTTETVDAQTSSAYVFTLPQNESLPQKQGDSKVVPGCQTKTYDNKVPADVIAKAKTFLDSGQPVVLHLEGNQTPLDNSNKPGVTEKWFTQDFALIE